MAHRPLSLKNDTVALEFSRKYLDRNFPQMAKTKMYSCDMDEMSALMNVCFELFS